MLYLIVILLPIYIIFYLYSAKLFKEYFSQNRIREYGRLNKLNHQLLQENLQRQENLALLTDQLEETVELYEVAKDVCRTLDEQRVFSIFKEKLNEYISLHDCLFIKQLDAYDQLSKDDFVFRLGIGSHSLGFLVGKGIKTEDRERCEILAQQFLLGLKRATLYHQVQELSTTDALTGLLNRRYFLKRLEEEILRANKFKLQFCFLMADIDRFKNYNDRFGHLVGDAVLRETGKIIKENTRLIDLVGRYGGEEFAVLLPETTQEGAYLAAERIRKDLESRKIRAYDEEISLTISIGLCAFPDDARTLSGLIDKSDVALYKAKNQGRNQVCISTASG